MLNKNTIQSDHTAVTAIVTNDVDRTDYFKKANYSAKCQLNYTVHMEPHYFTTLMSIGMLHIAYLF